MTQASSNQPGSRHPHKSGLLSAGSLIGDEVANRKDEKLGKIDEIMLDIRDGSVAYAVLSSGGFLGIGDRLHAIPWNALEVDTANHRILLDIDVERVKSAPGFDKDNWPNMADESWEQEVHSYYGTPRRSRHSSTGDLHSTDTRSTPPPI